MYAPDVFTPVRTRRTFEEAAEQIADKVRTGDLRVGDKLPGERALASQMQISRPTLREAVKVLVEAGLLEVRRGPGGGMFVATDVVGVELVRDMAMHLPLVPEWTIQIHERTVAAVRSWI